MRTSTLVVITACAAIYYFQHYRTPETEVDRTVALDKLPLQDAIKQVRGNGQPVLVSFEDPYCPYCARQDERLSRMDNITLYTFIVPILSDDSVTKARHIWCATNPASAWNDWMLKHRSPDSNSCNTSALDRNIALIHEMGFRGVPQLLRAE